MKTAFSITLTVGLATVAMLAIFLAAERQANRARQQENQRLAARLQALEEQLARLSELTNSLAAQFVEVRQVAASNALLAARLAQVTEASASPGTNVPRLQPYPVQVYVGQKAVGQGWAIPTNVRQDPKTGRVQFEQVVSLPETARGALTTYVTNTVERQVMAPVSRVVEREIYRDRWLPWWGPVAVSVPAVYPNHSSRSPHPVPPANPPPAVRPASGRPWTPVNVAPRPAPSSGLFVPPRPGDAGIFVPSGLR